MTQTPGNPGQPTPGNPGAPGQPGGGHPATAPGATGRPASTNGWGLAGFIVSLVSICTCGVIAPIGLILSIVGLFRDPKGLAIAGTIIGALFSLVGLFVGGSTIAGIMMLRDPGGVGQQTMVLGFAQEGTHRFYMQNNRMPDEQEFDQIVTNVRSQLPPVFTNIFGNIEVDYRYEPIDAHSARLILAGPDKKLDTADDMKHVIDGKAVPGSFGP